MIKKFMVMIVLLYCVCQLCFAETCPNIAEVKHQLPKGWALYDSYDGQPLSASRIVKFKNTVQQFALAEWLKDARKGGVIHCYYRDENGSDLEAYLAKENYVLFNPKNFWYQVSGYMHCAAGQAECTFKNYSLTAKHVTKTKPVKTKV